MSQRSATSRAKFGVNAMAMSGPTMARSASPASGNRRSPVVRKQLAALLVRLRTRNVVATKAPA